VIKAIASNGHYTLSVQDTGPGISPSDQVKIFEEFQQADDSTTKAKGGTGLGLSIAKRIINLHGGCIRVSSEPSRGSTFFIDVPIKVEQQAGHA
jgi:signal transduction histidine kinase